MTHSLHHRVRLRSLWLAFVCLALASLPTNARAQSDKAAAEALFREGMRLSKAGSFSEACPKFEESQRLEPSLGAQYYLADCYEKVGRSASAWANFSEVADKERLANDPAKEKAARARASALEPKLAYLSIEVSDATLSGLVVRRAELAVGSGQWGVRVPVDPGSVVLRASAPGYKEWSKTVEIASGASLTEKIPALEPLPVAPALAPEPVAAPAPLAAPAAPPAPPSHAQQTAGIVVAATGVVALGASGVFAVIAKGAFSDSKRSGECTPDNACSKKGIEDRQRPVSFADAATVVSIVGAAALVTGGVLWLSAPRGPSDSTSASAELGVGPSSLFLRGQF